MLAHVNCALYEHGARNLAPLDKDTAQQLEALGLMMRWPCTDGKTHLYLSPAGWLLAENSPQVRKKIRALEGGLTDASVKNHTWGNKKSP